MSSKSDSLRESWDQVAHGLLTGDYGLINSINLKDALAFAAAERYRISRQDLHNRQGGNMKLDEDIRLVESRLKDNVSGSWRQLQNQGVSSLLEFPPGAMFIDEITQMALRYLYEVRLCP